MYRRRAGGVVHSIVVGIGVGLSAGSALAHDEGSEAGRSGGPAGSSANCTECHTYSEGHGRIQLLGAPKRYRAGAVYDFLARIQDSDRVGAGFEISAETPSGHAGTWILTDPLRTRYADDQPEYVTHTLAGLEDSIDHWSEEGGGFEFAVRWEAPPIDLGAITLFLAGQSVDESDSVDGDHYYATYATMRFAMPGDADSDDDVDLRDVGAIQRCFGGNLASECEFTDVSGDGTTGPGDVADFASLLVGPTGTLPGAYLDADGVRGGQLYDRWWTVLGLATPTGKHPLYPAAGIQNGSTTYRCKECHGWDYKGVNGVYGSGSRYTGIKGIYGTTLAPQEVFDLLKADPKVTPNGHRMGAYGLSDADLWDLTKMSLEGVVNTSTAIQPSGAFLGNVDLGNAAYAFACLSCHGEEGTAINFGSVSTPEYVGGVADSNPWEFLHRIRFGVPATPMVATEVLGWPISTAKDIGAHSQTLPH